MKALIDGDIVAFRCAASAEDADEYICIARLDHLMDEILYASDSSEYELFISGEGNFRYKVFPDYKANRKDTPRPRWLDRCREHLVTKWKAEFAHGCEADDMLGTRQTDDTIICSIDKDLLQIQGKHYNFVKGVWFDQTYIEGMRLFFQQLLKGDTSDGIKGLKGVGEVGARKYLEGCDTVTEMYNVCKEQYENRNDDMMLTYGKCLWIWRKENDIWNPDPLTGLHRSSSEEEEKSDSTIQMVTSVDRSLDHIGPGNDGYLAPGLSLDITSPQNIQEV